MIDPKDKKGTDVMKSRKNGHERRMFENKRKFFKQLDEFNAGRAQAKKQRENRQRAQVRIQHRAAEPQPSTSAVPQKRTVDDRSDPNVTQQDEKRQRNDALDEIAEREAWWNRPENAKMTVRIVSKDFNVKLDDHDVAHVNWTVNRSVLKECRDEEGNIDTEFMERLNGTTGQKDGCIRVKMDTEDGIDWYRQIVPKIPPRSKGGPGYFFLAPGERRFADYQVFLECMDLTREGGMRDLEDLLRGYNPVVRKLSYYSCRFIRLDAPSCKVVVGLRLLACEAHILAAVDNTLSTGIEKARFRPIVYRDPPRLFNRAMVESGSAPPTGSTSSSAATAAAANAASATPPAPPAVVFNVDAAMQDVGADTPAAQEEEQEDQLSVSPEIQEIIDNIDEICEVNMEDDECRQARLAYNLSSLADDEDYDNIPEINPELQPQPETSKEKSRRNSE